MALTKCSAPSSSVSSWFLYVYLLAQRDGMLVKIFFFHLDMVTTNGCYVVYLFFFYGCISFFCLKNDFLDFMLEFILSLMVQNKIFVCVLTCTKGWDVGEDFFFFLRYGYYGVVDLFFSSMYFQYFFFCFSRDLAGIWLFRFY